MAGRKLAADEIGLPAFPDRAGPPDDGEPATLFDLSCHRRARDAIEFGCSIKNPGFNIFVLGADRSGRMTATLALLRGYAEGRPRPPDWVYLNNFKQENEPLPYALPAGQGRKFRAAMEMLLPALAEAVVRAESAPEFAERLQRVGESYRRRLDGEFEALRAKARGLGLDLQRSEQGLSLRLVGPEGEPLPAEAITDEMRANAEKTAEELRPDLRAFSAKAQAVEAEFRRKGMQLRRDQVEAATAPLFDALEEDFGGGGGLDRWVAEFRLDVLDELERFQPEGDDMEAQLRVHFERRYTVNLFVDRAEQEHSQVVLEPNPTYENVFGYIEYRSVSGSLETDFSLVRPGAIHRANGGVLVLRMEALARHPTTWEFLKGALRDGEIRIEEPHRENAVPIAGAPRPTPIPLDVKVVLVGAPQWYFEVFARDRDFPTYFKVKADIDPDMDADAANLATYTRLVRQAAEDYAKMPCGRDAISYLLGQSARWAENRKKLTCRFELVHDVLCEAAVLARNERAGAISSAHIKATIAERRKRNARLEDRAQEEIRRGVLLIATRGKAVGQVNALTVQDMGDYVFGTPSRVTARAFVGKLGVINVEHMTETGGPLQHKGVMVIEGFLNGRLARRFPLSFSGSVTFEQNYGGVEGDSASLAELVAILSSLADAPVRQDLAITGSLNQQGEAQAVGGVNQKVEGFFRSCEEAGLSGEQGVILPEANAENLTLRDEVAEAIAAGKFHLYAVRYASEAIELLTGLAAGEPDAAGSFPPESVFGRAHRQLEIYDRLLTERAQQRD